MGILDFLFPKKCFGCRASGTYLCKKCISEIPLARTFCPVCKKPSIDGMTHVHCKTPQSLDGVVCVFGYDRAVRRALISLKYKFTFDIAEELVEAVDPEKLVQFQNLKPTFVPIPLHRSRQNWRGFNQSEVLGELITKKFGWDFAPDLLVRTRKTPQQTGLSKEGREKNIRGAFSLNPSYHLQFTNYVLFDDVWTTGSTIKEAGKVLKRNGANRVWALTIGGPGKTESYVL